MSMQLLNRETIALFPTMLFTGTISDLTVCDRAETRLRELQRLGQGTAEDRAFITHDNIQELPEMKELAELFLSESEQVLNFYKIKRDSHYITNMWGNITHPNHRHHLHIHPNCLLSGILYVRTPKDCGPTAFGDPRPGAAMLQPSHWEMNSHNMTAFVVVPEKGRLMIWPSYLPHAVENGRANVEEDRIVVAFNIMVRGTIERPTARLELK
jgi:uncharacterized protein (TIGR02466 family)